VFRFFAFKSIKTLPETRHQSLVFRKFSRLVLGSISQILFTVITAISHLFFFYQIQNVATSKSDGISMGIVTFLVITTLCTHRLFGLFTASKTLTFWKSHCKQRSIYFKNEIWKTEMERKFLNLSNYHRSFTLIILSCGISYLVFVTAFLYAESLFEWFRKGFVANSWKLNKDFFFFKR